MIFDIEPQFNKHDIIGVKVHTNYHLYGFGKWERVDNYFDPTKIYNEVVCIGGGGMMNLRSFY